MTREIIFMMIAGNPNIDSAHKPKRKDEIFKLGIDEVDNKPKRRKTQRITEQDLKLMELMNYNKK